MNAAARSAEIRQTCSLTAGMSSWDASTTVTVTAFKERALEALARRPDPATVQLDRSVARLLDALSPLGELVQTGSRAGRFFENHSVPSAWHGSAAERIRAWPVERCEELVPMFPELQPREWEGCALRSIPADDVLPSMLQISPAVPANRSWAWVDALGRRSEASILSMIGPDVCVQLGPYLTMLAGQDATLTDHWTRTLSSCSSFRAGSPMGVLPIQDLADWLQSVDGQPLVASAVRRNASLGWGVSVRPESIGALNLLCYELDGPVNDDRSRHVQGDRS